MIDQKRTPEQELERYLAGHSELTQIYAEGNKLTTPARLESTIKQLAHAQVRSNRPARPADWFFPVSMAAGVLLAITVVFVAHFHAPAPQEAQVATDTTPVRDTSTPPTEIARLQTDAAPEPAEPAQTPLAQQEVTKPIPKVVEKKKPAPQQQAKTKPETFELPPHLREAVQTTRASGEDSLLPDEVLKRWTPEEWSRHIAELIAQGKQPLAEEYKQRFKVLFPGKTLPDPQ